MNEITIFKNERFGEVRTATSESGEPLFCLSDVCKAVGLTNPSSVKARLEKEDLQLIDLHALKQNEGAIIGNSAANFITESGFYDVLLYSDAPQVKPFRKWVTSEVLPSIRKHGAYMTPETVMQMFQNPDALIQLLSTLKNEQEQNALLRAQKDANAKAIEVMQPKAEYFDTVLRSSKLIATNVIAAELGISARKLNDFLREYKIQYKQGDLYFLYSDIREKGLEGYKTFVRTDPDTGETKTVKHMYWTEKGAFFIIDLYQKMTFKALN